MRHMPMANPPLQLANWLSRVRCTDGMLQMGAKVFG